MNARMSLLHMLAVMLAKYLCLILTVARFTIIAIPLAWSNRLAYFCLLFSGAWDFLRHVCDIIADVSYLQSLSSHIRLVHHASALMTFLVLSEFDPFLLIAFMWTWSIGHCRTMMLCSIPLFILESSAAHTTLLLLAGFLSGYGCPVRAELCQELALAILTVEYANDARLTHLESLPKSGSFFIIEKHSFRTMVHKLFKMWGFTG